MSVPQVWSQHTHERSSGCRVAQAEAVSASSVAGAPSQAGSKRGAACISSTARARARTCDVLACDQGEG
eukprot:1992511-Rhodomonas_salina.1